MEEELRLAARAIPLRARDGTVKAFAMVDADDYDELSQDRWYLHSAGYAARSSGDGALMHRHLLGLGRGRKDQVGKATLEGDHINRNRLDNQRANLRVCSRPENRQNTSATRNSRSKHRGVGLHKASGLWRAYGYLGGHHRSLGYFKTEEEAAEAARRWRAEHLPFATD